MTEPHRHFFTLESFAASRPPHVATVVCECGERRELRTAKSRVEFEADIAAYNALESAADA